MKKPSLYSQLAGWYSTIKYPLGAIVLVTGVFMCIHLLGGGKIREISYALLLIGTGALVAGIVSLARYLARKWMLDEALAHPPVENAAIPPARNAIEESYRTLANTYRLQRDSQQQSGAKAENERLNYFTLWVHQIKTPISALDLMAQSDDPVDRDLLRQEVIKIGQYADAALTFQRLQSLNSDLGLDEAALYPLCCSVVRGLRPIFLYRKITLHMEPFTSTVLTDAKWLGMAIGQVLTNALKYTQPGGSITIAMPAQQVLTIADTGAGIAAGDLPRVFDLGFTGQLGRADRSGEKSTGIGLYLCKQACDRLGHTVSIASTEGKGTTVTFDLRREAFESYS